tara:strand:+ start:147 stop:299 length:153 start_codon:yes stop_codon:yes gene_type:complete
MPNSVYCPWVIAIGAVAAIRTTTISPFEVKLFCKDTISLRGHIKVFFFKW